MKTSFTKKHLSLAVPCALALSFAGTALAQSPQPFSEKELWTENRNMVYRNAYGQCWQLVYGPPPANNECLPAIAQYVPPPPAPAPYVAPPPPPPVYVAPAPAPAPVIQPAPLPPRKTRG